MQHILAVAVGQPLQGSGPVVRDIIAKGQRHEAMRPYVTGLIRGLEKLGLKGGQDFDIDYVTAEPTKLKAAVKAAIDERKPDAIFAMSTSALKAAMLVTKDIQIVFPSISDPEGDKVAKSCAAPGMNATGVNSMRSQSAPECIELFKATVPSLRQVFGFHKPAYGPATRAIKKVQAAAKRAKIKFKSIEVKSRSDIAAKLEDRKSVV